MVAAEDKNFWTEGGISPTGILRAAIHNLTSSGGANGGSTITQEFVRGYYDGVGTQQTASRKIKEIFIAQKLASTKSKQWIMTNYLNLIYLGKNSYGVAAAAQTYFGKPVSELTVAQDAVLAGIIQQPSTYPLPSYRTQLKARWTYVLQQMVADKYITQAQMDSMTFPTLLTDSGDPRLERCLGHRGLERPVGAVHHARGLQRAHRPRSDGGDGVPSQQVETGGLKIVTTISYSKERALYKAVNANIATIKATPGATFPSYIRIGAELQNPSNGEILAMYPGPGQGMSTAQCAKWDCNLNTTARARTGRIVVQAVRAVRGGGGRDERQDQHPEFETVPVRATGRHSDDPVLDMKVTWAAGSEACPAGEPDATSQSRTTAARASATEEGRRHLREDVQNALAQSSNTAFTDLTHRVTTAQRDQDGEGLRRQHRVLPQS